MNVRFRMVLVILAVSALGISTAGTPATAETPSSVEARNQICAVPLERLSDLWGATESWSSRTQELGDALVDAMRQMLGSSDPSDLEVLEMQKDGAKGFRDDVNAYRAKQMKDDLSEIGWLGKQIRGAVSSRHRNYVISRIAKIRSLYREYWYNQFAPTYSAGFQELTAANIGGWAGLTGPLPSKVPIARQAFDRAYQGLAKLC
jgi:hypothetical protein